MRYLLVVQQLHDERELRLKTVAATITKTQSAKQAPVRQTKLAYVDTIAKPPREVRRQQLKYGTAKKSSSSSSSSLYSKKTSSNDQHQQQQREPAAVPMRQQLAASIHHTTPVGADTKAKGLCPYLRVVTVFEISRQIDMAIMYYCIGRLVRGTLL